MFEILGPEEFKSKYLDRADCAGVNCANVNGVSDWKRGNIVFIKEGEMDGPIYERFLVSQILYFKMLGTNFIVQDEDFYSFYK
jgi:hypothetical protein